MVILNGYVYVIKSEDDLYKIGRAVNPINRLRQLQTGSGKKLLLYRYLKVANMVKAEKSLHAIFSGARIHGEWFKCTSKDLILLDKIFGKSVLNQKEQEKLERMGLR